MSRTFTTSHAVRSRVPLIMALSGASGSGKTVSACRLAIGMQQVFGGSVHIIDTEKCRALHYADQYSFEHTPFDPPYSPGDYSDVLAHVHKLKPGVVIIDQLSYEHDGIGGVLEMQEAELQRMAGDDWQKRERVKMAAWIKPKAERRRLINEIVQIGSDFALIMCFRAKETAKPIKNEHGKTVIEDQGFMPIAAPEFLFEATASCVLYPGSNGVPTWQTEFKGERLFMKLPGQFRDILKPGRQICEDMGRELALWAKGDDKKPATTSNPDELLDADALLDVGRTKASGGTNALRQWWTKELSVNQRAVFNGSCPQELKDVAEAAK